MSAFVFESITAAQAAGYSAAADDLSFQTDAATGAMVSVAFLAPDQIAVTMGGQSVTFGAGIMNEAAISFANGSTLFIGGPGDDTGAGTAQGDALYGGPGADTLDAGAGDDLLQGNQGADLLRGGLGNDTQYGGQGDDNLDLDVGANFGQGNLGNDTVVAAAGAANSTLLGGQGDDQLQGGDAADFLNGNLGADSIAAGGGDDLILGEAGADSLDGGMGSDTFVAAAGSSEVSLAGADRIFNWEAGDRIDVAGAGGVAAYYQIPASYVGGGDYGYGGGGYMPPTASAITFAQALSTSNSWFRGHSGDNISTAQISEGVAVFVDSNGDRVADVAIILVGANIFELSGNNFI